MPRPPHAKPPSGVEIIHGLRAGLAVIAARPQDVVRVAFSKASAREVEPRTRALRSRGVPCRLLGDAELDRVAAVAQHEGLHVEAKPRPWLEPEAVGEHLARGRGVGVALDRVRNPYNVGAILRTAAFFGADAMLLGVGAQHPGLDAQAVRVAEGGAEHVALARTPRLAEILRGLREAKVRVLGTDASAKLDARDVPLDRPIVWVMGNEREGLHDRIVAECEELVALRGTGHMESLNVAVAAGILIAHAARRGDATARRR